MAPCARPPAARAVLGACGDTACARRLFWDMRVLKEEKAGDFSWNPLFKVQMNSIDGVGDLSACVSLSPPSLPCHHASSLPCHHASHACTFETESWFQVLLIHDSYVKETATKFVCGTEDGDVVFGDWTLKQSAGFIPPVSYRLCPR